MADSGVNKGRRRFLVGATTVIGAVGAVGVTIPFVKSWQPSARARAAGAPVEADASKLEVGQRMTVEWRGRPVWVVRRSDEMNERTRNFNPSYLADPDSEEPQQPAYVTGPLRAIRPEISVLVGICTHLGCSPLYRPEPGTDDMGDNWPGGYFCPCHGSRFDLAGRVFVNVPAPTNLVVPPHRYDTDEIIIIGENEETA